MLKPQFRVTCLTLLEEPNASTERSAFNLWNHWYRNRDQWKLNPKRKLVRQPVLWHKRFGWAVWENDAPLWLRGELNGLLQKAEDEASLGSISAPFQE